MNYIQINIGGRLRGWKINQMTMELWSKLTYHQADASTSNYAAVYAGLVANCYVKREEFTKRVEDKEFAATFEDVCDWVEDILDTPDGMNTLEMIRKAFEGSDAYMRTLEAVKNQLKVFTSEPVKKKQTVKKK